MRYMLLIYTREEEKEKQTPDEVKQAATTHWAIHDETLRRGIFRGAEPLHPTSTATTVRTQNGKIVTTDGPFAETKEQLAGYYILDCKSLDEAIEWAARIPICGGGKGCVEVRPIRDVTLRMGAAGLESEPVAR